VGGERFDSDGDGKLDRMHTDYTIPKETQTDGLKVPVIYEDSPYFAGTGGTKPTSSTATGGSTTSRRRSAGSRAGGLLRRQQHEPRRSATSSGTSVLARLRNRALSPRHRLPDGCPTSGGTNETLGATAIIDWLNGRKRAFTTRTGNVEAPPVTWHNGHTAMMGTSYNGTIPIAAATTGVQGLDAIVPISGISDWYDYYRANGMVRAPHSSGGTGPNDYLGEDLDVLVDVVLAPR
jgi:hypothetical protein